MAQARRNRAGVPNIAGAGMTAQPQKALHRRIGELEAENVRLRELIDALRHEKAHLQQTVRQECKRC